MRTSVAFCVLERPFVVWSNDVEADNKSFLTNIDSSFYNRAAHALVKTSGDAERGADFEEDQSRKDASSLARMLWHHGAETLVALLGSYIQAPDAVHAYVLKCRTEDVVSIADSLLCERKPTYHRLNEAPFTIRSLLLGIHRHAGWANFEDTIDSFERALCGILMDFSDKKHRWEYNSIKHGLRATHGGFSIAVGIEDTPGVPVPPDETEVVGSSRDSSFFNVAVPLLNATRKDSRVNFHIEKVALAWSLEKVLCDLQVLSLILHNTVSALRIVAGAPAKTVSFSRPADGHEWWAQYFSLYAGNIPAFSTRVDFDAQGVDLPKGEDVLASYRSSMPVDQN